MERNIKQIKAQNEEILRNQNKSIKEKLSDLFF